jgi:hypothetical protein
MGKLLWCVAVTSLATALTAVAADATVEGSWTAGIPRPSGLIAGVTFNFQLNGSKLGGTVVTASGLQAAIEDGKVKGDEISFNIEGTNGAFTGKLAGDEIHMKVRYERGEGGGRTMAFVARRAQ